MSTTQVNVLDRPAIAGQKPVRLSRRRLRFTRLFAIATLVALGFGSANWAIGHPLIELTLFMLGIAFVSFGAAGRAWATSYISGLKLKQLIVNGPYSICRNPLYFFNTMLGIGFGFCTKTFTLPLIIAIVLLVLYHYQIKREERCLSQQFGDDYQSYVQSVNRFFPSWRTYQEIETVSISTRPLRAGMFGIAFLLLLVGVLEMMRCLHQSGYLPQFFRIY